MTTFVAPSRTCSRVPYRPSCRRERTRGWSNNSACSRGCAGLHERAVGHGSGNPALPPARASDFDFGEVRLLTCSAEDLVVLKAFAGRERDWADIESVVIRQSRRLDWPLVFEELAPLAELRGGDETAARLQRLRG